MLTRKIVVEVPDRIYDKIQMAQITMKRAPERFWREVLSEGLSVVLGVADKRHEAQNQPPKNDNLTKRKL